MRVTWEEQTGPNNTWIRRSTYELSPIEAAEFRDLILRERIASVREVSICQ